MALNEVKLF